jgi:hypothetical protein
MVEDVLKFSSVQVASWQSLLGTVCTHAVRTWHSEHSPTHNKSPDNPYITIEPASVATLLTLTHERSWARVSANGGPKPGISLIRGQAFDRRESEERSLPLDCA